MVKRMGISRAILDNVVFCHQENSLWPLSEPKLLKEKFDAIFSATKYIKALESIRNCRKSHAGKSKESKAELKHLEQRKNKADELTKSLLFLKTKLEMATGELSARSVIYNNQKNEFDKMESDIKAATELLNEKTLLQTERDHQEEKIGLIKTNISTLFNLEENELLAKLSNLASDCEKENRVSELSGSISVVEGKLSCLEKELEDAIILRSVQNHQLEQEKAEKAMWKQNMLDAFQRYGFSFKFDEVNVGRNLDAFCVYVKKIDSEEDVQMDVIRKDIASISKKLEELSSSSREKRLLLKEKENKMTALSINSEKFSDSLVQIDKKINKFPDLCVSDAEIEKVDTSLRIYRENASNLDATLEKGNEEYTKLKMQHEQLIKELSLYENVKTLSEKKITLLEKLKSIENDKRDKAAELQSFFDYLRTSGDIEKCDDDLLVEQYDVLIMRLKGRLNCCMNNSFITKAKLDASKSDLEEIRLKLVSCEKDSLENASLLSKWNRPEDSVTEARENIAREIDGLKQNITRINALKGVFGKFLENSCVGSCVNACPLCDREFDDDTKQTSLSDKLERKVSALSSEEAVLSGNIEELQNLLIIFSNVVEVSTEDVAALESQVEQVEACLISDELQYEEDLKVSDRMQLMYDRALSVKETVLQLRRDCEKRKEILLKLGEIGENEANIQITCDEYNAKQEESGLLKDEVNNLIKEIDNGTNDLIAIKREIMNSDETLVKLRHGKDEFLKLSDEKAILQLQRTEITEELESIKIEIFDINNAISLHTTETTELSREKTELERNLCDLSSLFKRRKEERLILLHDLRCKLESFDKSDSSLEQSLGKTLLSIEFLESETKSMRENKIYLERELSSTKDSLDDINKTKRNLELNLELVQLKRSVSDLEDRMSVISENLNVFDVASLKEKINLLGNSCETSLKKVNQVQGTINEIYSQIKHVESELSSDFYAKAIQEYDDMALRIKLHDLVCSDLDKFYQALDSAIMKFHSIKMEEINSIIKDYWFETYQGDDIDTIKIVSECSDVSNKTLANKLTFNYKVVMVRDDVSLDMRGRCSAGQKMLASIIIRLALAETFCDNCRIMTLDEPTTNIDKDNVTHLAEAILKLLKMNSEKKQQMMIITHDEGLVETLCRSDLNENYCRVYKDVNGCSKMHKRSVQDLL